MSHVEGLTMTIPLISPKVHVPIASNPFLEKKWIINFNGFTSGTGQWPRWLRWPSLDLTWALNYFVQNYRHVDMGQVGAGASLQLEGLVCCMLSYYF